MAISSYNSKFSYKKGSSGAAVNVSIKTFPGVAAKRSSIEITDMSMDARTYIPGIRETPETLDFDANYDKAVYAALDALGDATDIEQTLELSDGSKWTWTGAISPALKDGSVNGVVEMTITSIPSTVPTYSGT